MKIKKKISNLIYYIKRPMLWNHRLHIFKRQFLVNHDTIVNKKKAADWANANSSKNIKDAFLKLGFNDKLIDMDMNLVENSKKSLENPPSDINTNSNLDLLYNAVRMTNAKKVIETGVAYGWSSLAILQSLSESTKGYLYSVDLPYINKQFEKYVGIVVPKHLNTNWKIFKEPDRVGLEKAIIAAQGYIDFCHYDSDKSWWGRHYAYPLLWNSIRLGGLFISDDIDDNLYFKEFVEKKKSVFAIIEYNDRFIGLIRKTK
mgnify:FL=1